MPANAQPPTPPPPPQTPRPSTKESRCPPICVTHSQAVQQRSMCLVMVELKERFFKDMASDTDEASGRAQFL